MSNVNDVENDMITAKQAGLIACEYCHTLSADQAIAKNECLRCPCCNAVLHSRKPNSLAKTWSYLWAAVFLYIPANVLPIMTVIYQGTGEPSTIFEGVMHLLESGMWPLAAIVFIASLFVPIMKLLVLAGLALSVQFRWQWNPKERTRFYRMTEFVGRWSMVDIFVIAILVALVQFGNLASVYPGLGAVSFAAVVILTMLAAHTFDPRLIWDVQKPPTKIDRENNEQ